MISPTPLSAAKVQRAEKGHSKSEKKACVRQCRYRVRYSNVSRRAILGQITAELEEAARSHLAPRQVSVGVKGGISILFFGLRLLLEQRGDFVVVRIDLRNALS